MPAKRQKETRNAAKITAETFRFFRDLNRNNRKEWMDENRDRYQCAVVQPFRGLLEAMAPAMHKLGADFDLNGRTGANFSRINRDIRFARDKTPYRPQMYLMFPPQGGQRPGELYVGITENSVTAGYRIYLDRNAKGALGARVTQAPKWCAQQKRRLARQFESYWYSMEKGEWTKNSGWPVTPEEWKKLKAWVVRRKLKPSAAAKPSFPGDAANLFRQLFPLFQFLSQGG